MSFTQIYWLAAVLGAAAGFSAAACYYTHVLRKRDRMSTRVEMILAHKVVELEERNQLLAHNSETLSDKVIELSYPELSLVRSSATKRASFDTHVEEALAHVTEHADDCPALQGRECICVQLWPEGSTIEERRQMAADFDIGSFYAGLDQPSKDGES